MKLTVPAGVLLVVAGAVSPWARPEVAAQARAAQVMAGPAGGAPAARGTAQAATQAAAGAMPIDVAFGRHQLAREDRVTLTRDAARAAYVVHQPPEKSPPDSRYLPTGVPVSAVGMRVFVSDVATGRTRQIAAEAGNCWRPRWSPDDTRLAFYCDQGGMPQLWVYETATDKARRVSDARIKAKLWAGDEPRWSPDGREVFVPLAPPPAIAALYAGQSAAERKPKSDPAKPAAGPQVTVHVTAPPAAAKPGADSKEKPKAERLEIAHYMRENLAAIGAITIATGAVRTVAAADATPAPSVLRVSPSGKFISYLSVFHKPRAIDTVSYHDLAIVPAAGGPVQTIAQNIVLTQGDYHLGTYVWHPTRDALVYWKDGGLFLVDLGTPAAAGAAPTSRRLAESLGPATMAPLVMTADGAAIIAGIRSVDMRDYRDPYPQALAIIPLDGSAPKTVPIPDDSTFLGIVKQDDVAAWQPSSAAGTVTVSVREQATAQDALIRVDVASGRVTPLWKGLARMRFAGAAANQPSIIASFEDVRTAGNLYRFNADFTDKQKFTDVEPRLANVTFGPVETFETSVPQYDGSLARVATAVLLPPGAKKGDKLPALVFLYPGGKVSRAAAEFGGGMPSTVPVSAFTTRGYAVLLAELPISPDGSAGNPVSEMVDVLLPQVYHAAALGYVDVNRLAVSGQSYGGYGTMSILSGTNLFRAGVAISGSYDLATAHSWMGNDGGPGMSRWAETGQGRMGTHPWGDLRRYLVNSPYFRADYIHTPVLMLHGEIDFTCPVEDARKMFNALRRLERTAELRTYADEGHVVYSWSLVNAVDATNRMFAFLEEHVRNPKPKAEPGAGAKPTPSSQP